MDGAGMDPAQRWAATLCPGSCVKGAQHGRTDRGGAVVAAEFARLEAFGKGAVHGALDGAGGLGGPGMSMPVAEPVEHQRGGKNHGGPAWGPPHPDFR